MTSPPTAEPHVRAVLEQLHAGVPAQLTVSLGKAPTDTAPPYVVLYPDAGDVSAARLCGDRDRIVVHLMLHAIGTGPEQASWAADQARTVLLGQPPTVAGRRVYRLTQVLGSAPLTRDDDINPALYLQPAEYRLLSDPA